MLGRRNQCLTRLELRILVVVKDSCQQIHATMEKQPQPLKVVNEIPELSIPTTPRKTHPWRVRNLLR